MRCGCLQGAIVRRGSLPYSDLAINMLAVVWGDGWEVKWLVWRLVLKVRIQSVWHQQARRWCRGVLSGWKWRAGSRLRSPSCCLSSRHGCRRSSPVPTHRLVTSASPPRPVCRPVRKASRQTVELARYVPCSQVRKQGAWGSWHDEPSGASSTGREGKKEKASTT
jgi:hypothetical protein